MSTQAIETIGELRTPGYLISIFYRPVVLYNQPLDVRIVLDEVSRADFDKGKFLVREVKPVIEPVPIPASNSRYNRVHSGYVIARSLWEDNIAGAYHSAAMSSGLPGDVSAGMPGIIYSDSPRPTNEQLAQMIQGQIDYANGWMREADTLFHTNKADKITGVMYDSALWMKIEVEWAKRRMADVIVTKTCQFCGASIPKAVAVCAQCHNVVDREKFDELIAAQNAQAAIALEKATAPAPPPQQPKKS